MSASASHCFQIFLVDDHVMVRQGLATVLAQAGFAICGQAGDLRGALGHPELPSAHLAVVDLSMGEDSGVELIQALCARRLPSLVYSMHEDSNVVRNAFAAGAMGYVTKREVASCLIEAVRCILAGRQYVSPRAGVGLIPRAMEPSGPESIPELSEQQQRMYELLGEGLGTDEIAQRLRVSPRTVETYGARMIEKMNVSGMKELRRRAIAARCRPPN